VFPPSFTHTLTAASTHPVFRGPQKENFVGFCRLCPDFCITARSFFLLLAPLLKTSPNADSPPPRGPRRLEHIDPRSPRRNSPLVSSLPPPPWFITFCKKSSIEARSPLLHWILTSSFHAGSSIPNCTSFFPSSFFRFPLHL